ncbi:MAG TPA: RluA family pseudouridine synthase [Saprospiraceae bacterium]|nr:RluA family pseudouridine synthase [Saprospiraceae bacterium]HND86896.1 RluA family pseudouridine synthase [Saprospiraceae bacterium]HNG89701.1 RluA family pseudouridine synthase [Saprospiraceae bacterium]
MSSYTLLHADDHVLVVNKPAGLLTIPDRFGNQQSLLAALQRDYGHVLTVHRLDRETSGVLCFARNEAAHRHLSMQFEHHQTDKFYLALLDGVLHHEEGEIDKPIGEHATISGKMAITNAGKPSLTFYRAVERFRRFTLAEAQLKTGRTHQVRIHFQSIGYPLAVDALYGKRAQFFLSEIKGKAYKSGKYSSEERPLMERTSLHAYRLRFDHPATGERMEFKAELPKDFQAVLAQLRKLEAGSH